MLVSTPVLSAPNFDHPFKLAVDASDVAVGAVLLQADSDGIDHPVCYFSRKLDKSQRNYSTIEKACLALILALQHFEIYVTSTNSPLTVFSDHNPLVFLHKIKDKNQRLVRWTGVCFYKNTIWTSDTSKVKTILSQTVFQRGGV